MSLVFQPITGNKFFEGLGIPCGRLINDAGDCAEFSNMAFGRNRLAQAIEYQFCTADEAQQLDNQMAAAGILADPAAIVSHCVGIQVPDGETDGFRYERCHCDEVAVSHGRLYRDEEMLAGPFLTQLEVLEGIQDLVMDDIIQPAQASWPTTTPRSRSGSTPCRTRSRTSSGARRSTRRRRPSRSRPSTSAAACRPASWPSTCPR